MSLFFKRYVYGSDLIERLFVVITNGVKIRFLAILLLFLPISSELRAQIDDVLEDLTTIDDIDAESWEQTYDLLSDLLENPLNLNTATPDDLRQLPFLNEEQIEEISALSTATEPCNRRANWR